MSAWFRCSHKKTSLPITRPRGIKERNRVANTYVVCLKCSEKIPYSHSEMKTLPERRRSSDTESAPISAVVV
jgi:hypothetical protein